MKLKFLVLIIGLMPALVVAQVDETETTIRDKSYTVPSDGVKVNAYVSLIDVNGVPTEIELVVNTSNPNGDNGPVTNGYSGGCFIDSSTGSCKELLRYPENPHVVEKEQQKVQHAKEMIVDGVATRAWERVQEAENKAKLQVAVGLADKIAAPVPSATMSSPVPPVSSSVNSQMPASYPGQSIAAQPAVGMPPPTIRAEMPGQAVPSMPRVEPQMQNRSPAVNLAPNR